MITVSVWNAVWGKKKLWSLPQAWQITAFKIASKTGNCVLTFINNINLFSRESSSPAISFVVIVWKSGLRERLCHVTWTTKNIPENTKGKLMQCFRILPYETFNNSKNTVHERFQCLLRSLDWLPIFLFFSASPCHFLTITAICGAFLALKTRALCSSHCFSKVLSLVYLVFYIYELCFLNF